jgi:hypothetical protein
MCEHIRLSKVTALFLRLLFFRGGPAFLSLSLSLSLYIYIYIYIYIPSFVRIYRGMLLEAII